MIYVDTSFMFTLSMQQLKALSTDAKVETWRSLHGTGVPSEEERFCSVDPQEQAEQLYDLMHPGEEVPADRLTNYIELLEHLSTTKHALRESTRNVKDYSNLEAEVLTQLLISARAMASTMEEFHRIVGMACFV